MQRLSVLIADGVPASAQWARDLFGRAGFDVSVARTGHEALHRLSEDAFDLVLLEHFLEGPHGTELVRDVRRRHPETPVLAMNHLATVPAAMAALRDGAAYYLCKPVDPYELQVAVSLALAPRGFSGAFSSPQTVPDAMPPLSPVIGVSDNVKQVRAMIVTAAHSACPVLVYGPSGTGKEVITRSIHDLSARRTGPFLPVNCGGLPEGLAESELFGAEKGAFTGAGGARQGLFRAAEGGTIFLDELGEMSPSVQVKLLRTLQERTVRSVGGTDEVPVDVRVIAATNRHPLEAIQSGRLREDLYYRLAVLKIEMLPLRARPEDVAPLCEGILHRLSARLERDPPELSDSALEILQAHPWPGNVRELENVLECVLALGVAGPRIDPCHLPASLSGAVAGVSEPIPARLAGGADGVTTLKAAEHAMIRRALLRTKGNKAQAASLLGITRSYLYRRLHEMHPVSPEA